MESKKSISKTKDTRVRNITFVLFEDSCTPNWKELLDNEHIPYMYRYHDKDVNPDNGKPKKPHYHVILCFEGKKSSTQLQAYADLFGAANGVYKEVQSLRGMARYLCHMDNPEKYQYDSKEVHTCSIDYNSIVGMASDKYKIIAEMIDFCEQEDIVSYSDLLIYAKIHRYDWFKALCDSSTIVMKEFLQSKYWTENNEVSKISVNEDTGEVSIKKRTSVLVEEETGEVIEIKTEK